MKKVLEEPAKGSEKNIAIYSRKSKYTGKGESIGNQIEICRDYIVRHRGESYGARIVVYEDEGFSGKNTKRPGFQQMMQDAQEGRVESVIVYRLDRISRNVSDFLALMDELDRLEIGFTSVSENIDPSNPLGKAMMMIAAIFSQLERETIAERIRDNMHELAKTGRWLGGTTPTGFTSEKVEKITIDGKRYHSYCLTAVPEELGNVRLIYQSFLETQSLTQTEAAMMRLRIRTKTGREYSRFAIKAILQNPVYLVADRAAYRYFSEHGADIPFDEAAFDGTRGIMPYHRTDQVRGNRTKFLPVDQWIIAVGQHPGTIPSRDWLRVQELLARNKDKTYRQSRQNEAQLTGVIFCSCGARMFPRLTDRRTAAGDLVYSYICDWKNRSRRALCSQKNISGNMLDAAVLNEIKRSAEDKSQFVMNLEAGKRRISDPKPNGERELVSLRGERMKMDETMTGLVDSLAGIEISAAKHHVVKRIEMLDHDIRLADERIWDLEQSLEASTMTDDQLFGLEKQLSSFSDLCDVITVAERRMVIQKLVQRVVWDGQYAHVYLLGSREESALAGEIIPGREDSK